MTKASLVKVSKFLKKKKKKIARLLKIKFKKKILQVKRVTKVVKGGKKMSFRVAVVVGNAKRKVGLGIGKAADVNGAIEKAILNAKKHLIKVPLTKKKSIPHSIYCNFGACKVMIRPASLGTGIIAGGSMRTVLELAGIKNALAKQFGSKNILNNAKATIKSLYNLGENIRLARFQSKDCFKFYKIVMKKFRNAS